MINKQRKIIKEIKRLYDRREPLNITAVKRSHPELMKAVYDIKPFWGWKRALEDAGVDYSDVKVEVLDYAVCEICGIERRSLSQHLAMIHGVDKYEYRMDYPDADIFCEEIRARKSKMNSAVLAHWEPLWTREYVMDRIMEFHMRGIRLNERWVTMNEGSLASFATRRYFDCWQGALKAVGLDPLKIRMNRPNPYKKPKDVLRELRRRKRLGLPVNHGAIHAGEHRDSVLGIRASTFFGSWNGALRAAGFDPVRVRRNACRESRRYPDKESVIEEIKRRKEKGLPITLCSMETGLHKDPALGATAREYFGSWNKVLASAGVDPGELLRSLRRQRRRYPCKESVISEIRRRRKTGQPLTMLALNKGPERDAVLPIWACEYFGSWAKALETAGVDDKTIRRCIFLHRRKYPDKASIVREIKSRRKRQLPLNHGAVAKGRACDSILPKYAKKYFGAWDKALKAAGVNPLAVHEAIRRKRRKYPDKESVVRAIKRRSKDKLPLNCMKIVKGPATDIPLWFWARKYFGSWGKALEKAQIDLALIRKRLYREKMRYSDRGSVIREIRRRRHGRLPLSRLAMEKGSSRDARLVLSAKDYFGSWDAALAAAGLDPTKIRKQLSSKMKKRQDQPLKY